MVNSLIIKCPKCGQINKASAMNCDKCHINLAWALENQALFEREGKPEQTDMRASRDPSFGERSFSTRLQHLGCIILVMVVSLASVINAGTDWPFVLIGLLLFVAVNWFIGTHEREQEHELDKIWSELARQTGLTYIPGKKSFLGIYIPPSIQGEYRGRYVSLTLLTEGGTGGEYDAPRMFTKISLLVNNRAHFSLEIQERGFLDRRGGRRDVISGNEEFDRRFRVRGAPQEFVHRAIRRTDLQNTLGLDESQSKIMKMALPLSWASSSRPTITLNELDLVCLQHGALTLVYAQIAVLNMLCNLAKLAEEMGSDSASPDARRN